MESKIINHPIQELVEPKACLAIFRPIEAEIAEYKKENEDLVFDYASPGGNKDARSHIYKLRLVKGRIVEAHKTVKADIVAAGRQIDGFKNKLLGDVEEMIDVHYQPIKLIEQEQLDLEAARMKALADAEAARIKAEEDAKAEAEAKRLTEIADREAVVREAEAAVLAAQEKIAAREAELAAEEHARQAENDRVINEKRIAEEAKFAAEKAAKAALEAAEKKRLADIAAVEAKAKADAEAKELAERRRVDAENAKKAAEAAAEQKRQANKKHQSEINREVCARLETFGISHEHAYSILKALIAGTIPHVKIEY